MNNMKKILAIAFFMVVALSEGFAQSQSKATASTGSDNIVRKRKSVEATQKAYFKKVSKKTAKSSDCDCPGNPKNKKNRQNPYKRKRGGS